MSTYSRWSVLLRRAGVAALALAALGFARTGHGAVAATWLGAGGVISGTGFSIGLFSGAASGEILVHVGAPTGFISVTDTKGNSYVTVTGGGNASLSVQVFRATVATPLTAADTINVSFNGNTSPGAAVATLYTGTATPALDLAAWGPSATPSFTAGPVGPTAQANELLVGGVASLVTTVSAAAPGYTYLGQTSTVVSSQVIHVWVGTQAVSSVGTYSFTGTTLDPSPVTVQSTLVTLKDAVAPVSLQKIGVE